MRYLLIILLSALCLPVFAEDGDSAEALRYDDVLFNKSEKDEVGYWGEGKGLPAEKESEVLLSKQKLHGIIMQKVEWSCSIVHRKNIAGTVSNITVLHSYEDRTFVVAFYWLGLTKDTWRVHNATWTYASNARDAFNLLQNGSGPRLN